MSDYLAFAVQVLASAGISGILAAALVWFGRSWIAERLKQAIKSEYDQKLETHKAQLKAASETEIERLRSQLSIAASEHEIRFSRLHERRAEVVAETYRLLREVYFKLHDYVKIFEPAGDVPRAERGKAAADAHAAFRGYYRARLIFLPQDIAAKLEAIDIALVRAYNEFAIMVDRPERQHSNDALERWTAIVDRLSGEIDTASRDLEGEFRRLLGGER